MKRFEWGKLCKWRGKVQTWCKNFLPKWTAAFMWAAICSKKYDTNAPLLLSAASESLNSVSMASHFYRWNWILAFIHHYGYLIQRELNKIPSALFDLKFSKNSSSLGLTQIKMKPWKLAPPTSFTTKSFWTFSSQEKNIG